MTGDDLGGTIDAAREATGPPSEDDDVTFEAPWQARAFAITVALRRREAFDWEAFQARLIAELEGTDADDEASYYQAWLRAIEGLLLEDDVVEADELARRTREFQRGVRDASEFVVGDHGHGHDHDHTHHDHAHHADQHHHNHDVDG